MDGIIMMILILIMMNLFKKQKHKNSFQARHNQKQQTQQTQQTQQIKNKMMGGKRTVGKMMKMMEIGISRLMISNRKRKF